MMVSESWIRAKVRDEREALHYAVDRLIGDLFAATPEPGGMGPEYEEALRALGKLQAKIHEYRHQDLILKPRL